VKALIIKVYHKTEIFFEFYLFFIDLNLSIKIHKKSTAFKVQQIGGGLKYQKVN